MRRQVGAEGRGEVRLSSAPSANGIGDGGREGRRPSKQDASALASRGGGIGIYDWSLGVAVFRRIHGWYWVG